MCGEWRATDTEHEGVMFVDKETPYIMYLTFPQRGIKQEDLKEEDCLFVDICFN
jgi:hypothetical protein